VVFLSEQPYEFVLPLSIKQGIINTDSLTTHFESTAKEDILYQIRQIVQTLTNEDARSRTVTSALRKTINSINEKYRYHLR
jgi:hypothetical protein